MSISLRTPMFREDSDADDEYDRHEILSPGLQTEFTGSPTESEPMSAEQTPTFHMRDGSPRSLVIDWSAEQSADFIANLGLDQYADKFVDECITGDALVALLHQDLKDMGIHSVGHRLTILKGVYDMKVKQNIPMEENDYIPLSADASSKDSAPPSQDDIARIITIIRDRDEEIRSLRDDLVRMSEENRKFREELSPYIRASKPLPTPDTDAEKKPTTGLSRKFSDKRINIAPASNGMRNTSPTIVEPRGSDATLVGESPAATVASNVLTNNVHNGLTSPNQAQQSPTSPSYLAPGSTGPTPRQFQRSDHDIQVTTPFGPPSSASTTMPSINTSLAAGSSQQPSVTTPVQQSGGQSNGEIFKSFRVSIEDPCHKVLPVALKKYNIMADWRQYALYIVYGDQERCLGLNEKPLILFKQLDKEGRKPMFMLRKHAAPEQGHTNKVTRPAANQVSASRALPGGVL